VRADALREKDKKIREEQREKEATMKRTAAAHSHGYFLNREGLVSTLIFAFAAVSDVPFINISQSTRAL